MKNVDEILNVIHSIEQKVKEIHMLKAEVEDIEPYFVKMDESLYEILTKNFKTFDDCLCNVIERINKLNAFVQSDIVSDYDNIYNTLNNNMGLIVDDIKKDIKALNNEIPHL